jgi:hypothetical protein
VLGGDREQKAGGGLAENRVAEGRSSLFNQILNPRSEIPQKGPYNICTALIYNKNKKSLYIKEASKLISKL